MTFDHSVDIDATRERVWAFLMDVPSVARCLPGLDGITEDGPDRYQAGVKVKVGPIALTLRAEVALVEKDEAAGRAVMRVDSFDKRVGGGAKATMTMQITERSPGKTTVSVHTEAQVLGKLGTFGQGIIKKKADQIVAEAAQNIATALNQKPAG